MSVHSPANEAETILNFVSKTGVHRFEIVKVWSVFPDADIRDTANDIVYKVEFEYKLSSFIKHGHNPFNCNFVICWKNDIPYFEFPLTIWEVSTDTYPKIEIPDETKVYQLHELIKSKRYRKYDYRNKPVEVDFSNLLETIKGIKK